LPEIQLVWARLMFDRMLSMAPVAVVPVESDLADADRLHIGDLEGRPSSLIPTLPSWLAAPVAEPGRQAGEVLRRRFALRRYTQQR
jgi:hypothetical protein